MQKVLYTMEEAADLLSVGRSTVYDLIRMRLLETVKIGRSRRVTAAALTELVERLREQEAA
ncbi:helix-turn-helix domain-containing protein [Actinomycetospora callitridis]|uniref:helix-turn-helix domain-containing protein n=1 Tax=Actinomycetospora callitridis TaxID=913944 RepID=UPI002366C28D|nr:helix-turn-helix domain-containing protein [Actinomycetospora callitridis]MDD7920991.1 helix-turn-helix domain-containing protein [Actinomycetospora callitridis]